MFVHPLSKTLGRLLIESGSKLPAEVARALEFLLQARLKGSRAKSDDDGVGAGLAVGLGLGLGGAGAVPSLSTVDDEMFGLVGGACPPRPALSTATIPTGAAAAAGAGLGSAKGSEHHRRGVKRYLSPSPTQSFAGSDSDSETESGSGSGSPRTASLPGTSRAHSPARSLCDDRLLGPQSARDQNSFCSLSEDVSGSEDFLLAFSFDWGPVK